MKSWNVTVHTVEPGGFKTSIMNVKDKIVDRLSNIPSHLKHIYDPDFQDKCELLLDNIT